MPPPKAGNGGTVLHPSVFRPLYNLRDDICFT